MPRHLVVGVNSDESVLQASLVGLLVRGDRTVCDMFGRNPKQNQRLRLFRQRTYSVTGGHGVLFCNITSDSIRFAVTARPKVFCLC